LKAIDLNNDGNCDVVAGSDDGNIYAIDGKNGSTIWTVNVEGKIKEIEIAQMDEYDVLDIVAAVSWPANKVVVINGSNGNLIWEYDNVDYVSHIEVFDVNNDAFNDIAIATPKMGSQAGELIMVDGLSHNAIWTVSPFYPSYSYALSHGDLNGDGIDDVVAGGSGDDTMVHAYNGLNGNELWNFVTGGGLM